MPRQAEALKALRKRGSDASRFISHLMCAEWSPTSPVPGEWSVGQLLAMVKADFNDYRRNSDDFFALRLTIKACSPQGRLLIGFGN